MRNPFVFSLRTVFLASVIFSLTIGAGLSVYPEKTHQEPHKVKIHEGGALVLACPDHVYTLDPQKAETLSDKWLIEQIYDGLLEYDQNDRIVPVLAASMPVRISDHEYILEIKHDIKFHDGKPLDANDVVFTIKRLLDPATQCPSRQIFQGINSVEVIAPMQIKITLGHDCPDLLELLARHEMRPLSIKAVTRYGSSYGKVAAVGTGPFRFIEWERGKDVILERNYSYKTDKANNPFLHRIIFHFPEPGSDVVQDLRRRRIDIAANLSTNEASGLASRSYIRLVHKPGQRICQIYLNADRSPFDRPNIRKAISLGINREEIAKKAFDGFATPALSCLPQWHRLYDAGAGGQFFDPNLALKLLADEGFTSDLQVSFSLMYTDDEPFRAIAQIIKEQLSHINVLVDLFPMSKNELFDFVYGRGGKDRAFFQAALEDWEDWRGGGGADQFTWRLYHHSSLENKLGASTYTWEEDLSSALKECDPNVRDMSFSILSPVIDKAVVAIYLCYPHRIWAARSWVKGDFTNSLGDLFLDSVWVR
ncbi:ABC transporter substrate-binding protein [bacterium]|nr:ABC transporter substrate-binding protein [bacterium]